MSNRCSKCKKEKSLDEFHNDKSKKDGHCSYCKVCACKSSSRWSKENREKQNEYCRQWRMKNPEKDKAMRKKERQNPERKKYQRQWMEDWRKANPQRNKDIINKSSRKRRGTVRGKLDSNMKTAICLSLKGMKKKRHWEDLVGYSKDELKKHIEFQFTERMSWDNYGEWHIDHIIPISFFQYKIPEDVEFRMCWRLENLQPLWAFENQSKHDRLIA